MKTPEEWQSEYTRRVVDYLRSCPYVNPKDVGMWEKFIQDVQKEAWNSALDWAATNSKVKTKWVKVGGRECPEHIVDEDSILKGKI